MVSKEDMRLVRAKSRLGQLLNNIKIEKVFIAEAHRTSQRLHTNDLNGKFCELDTELDKLFVEADQIIGYIQKTELREEILNYTKKK